MQMILDGKLAGTLDAGAGCLEVFTNTATEGVYPAVLAALTNIGEAIDSLAIRSLKVAA
jgi:26S proteasome regulatory subunit N6